MTEGRDPLVTTFPAVLVEFMTADDVHRMHAAMLADGGDPTVADWTRDSALHALQVRDARRAAAATVTDIRRKP